MTHPYLHFIINGLVQGVCTFAFLGYFYVYFVDREEKRVSSRDFHDLLTKLHITLNPSPTLSNVIHERDERVKAENDHIIRDMHVTTVLLLLFTALCVWMASHISPRIKVSEIFTTALFTLLLVGAIKYFFLMNVALKYRMWEPRNVETKFMS